MDYIDKCVCVRVSVCGCAFHGATWQKLSRDYSSCGEKLNIQSKEGFGGEPQVLENSSSLGYCGSCGMQLTHRVNKRLKCNKIGKTFDLLRN